jgi:succinoglycan biosynthesis protein ExoM
MSDPSCAEIKPPLPSNFIGSVAVVIPTFRRPEILDGLLNQLGEDFSVIVADNDPLASARPICRQRNVRYFQEPQRGISYVRNALVGAASGFEAIAFIDDDEIPDSNWLQELLRVQSEYCADIVAGPVLPIFEGGVPDWVKIGRFSERPRYATGARVEQAGTGNLLITRRVIDAMNPCFSTKFALSGGEDTEFILRALNMGFKLVWADNAIVREYVPRSRCSADWLRRRAYSSQSNWVRCLLEIEGRSRMRIGGRLLRAGFRFLQGLALAFAAPFVGQHLWVRAQMHIAGAFGTVAGVLNQNSQFYGTQPCATNPEDSK